MSIFSAGLIMGLGMGLASTAMVSLMVLRRQAQKVPVRVSRRMRRGQ